MTVASDLEKVKRRLDDYLWRDNTRSTEILREILRAHFFQFEDVAIVGGMVRDFARRGRAAFKSDVDLVIDAPASYINKLARKLNATPNRFGGYSYMHPLWKVDFWALENTWAYKENHIDIDDMLDVVRCTFFDWDAIFYHIHHRAVFAGKDYIEKLHSKTIDVNLLDNPSIDGNLLRAIRRICLWNLRPGPLLKGFFVFNLDEAAFSRIGKIERSLYANSVVTEFSDYSAVIEYMFGDASELRGRLYSAQQLEFDWSAPVHNE